MQALTDAQERQAPVRLVDLGAQHGAIEDDLKAAFGRLLTSSAYTLGAEVEQFEAEFARYCGVAQCVGVASGTAALELMLRAYGIGPGDEVVVPAHTFIASALAVAHVGATPVLCDVEPATGLIGVDAAHAELGPRTAAVLAVHLYGQTCDMTALGTLARRHGVLVLEDAAQAHGARHRGRRAGSLGDAAAFSFYPSKNLGALGDGGAICTDDEQLAARLRRLRNLGQRAKGEHIELGFNERLDGLQAALLRVKLAHLDEWNAARRAHAARYRELLAPSVTLVDERPENECVYHLFAARFADRARVATALRARGIETAVHYSPALHHHPVWRDSQLRHGPLPVSEEWAAQELSLPMHPELRPCDIDRVATALLDAR